MKLNQKAVSFKIDENEIIFPSNESNNDNSQNN
jgi:hypothetical protein